MGEFTPQIRATRELAESAQPIADALEMWAVLRSFLKLVDFLRIGTINHPEVQRAPILLSALEANLAENVDRHVNIKAHTIFSEDIAGNFDEIRSWQEAGYSTERTASNYPKRLKIWKAIYDDVPIIRNLKGGRAKEIDITGRYDVSYESIIEARMSYAGGDRVPYWHLLNYGTDIGPLSGYPSVRGIHFLEKAQATIPGNLALAEDHLVRYYDALLRGKTNPNVPFGVDQESGWVLLYGKSKGFLARFAAINFRTGQSNTFSRGNLPAALRSFL
jgi:hypothetical protein